MLFKKWHLRLLASLGTTISNLMETRYPKPRPRGLYDFTFTFVYWGFDSLRKWCSTSRELVNGVVGIEALALCATNHHLVIIGSSRELVRFLEK